jgi:hypothetical protein
MDNQSQLEANLSRIAILENERLREIVQALGPDWKILEVDSINRNHFKFGPEGAEWYLHTRDTRSFEFWVSDDGLRSVHSYYTDQFPSANISERKSPDKVAAELQRRIIEPSLVIIATLRIRLVEKQRRESCIADNIRRLIEANPKAHQIKHSSDAIIYLNSSNRDIYLSGTVTEDAIRLERVSLPIEIAIELFRLTRSLPSAACPKCGGRYVPFATVLCDICNDTPEKAIKK